MLYELFVIGFQSLWLIMPAYIANSLPVLGGGGTPVDFNRKFFDGGPIFGPGKTWRGAFVGVTGASAAAWIQALIQSRLDLSQYELITMSIELGFLLGAGAITGDIVKSFFKRRMKIKRGEKWPIIDQLDFIVGALIFSMFSETALAYINWKIVLFLILFTPVTHRIANVLAYKARLKSVPW